MSIEGKIRVDILTAANKAGKSGAHIAPSLSLVEICLSILETFDKEKDSFILGKGHGALGYYATMHQLKMITDEQFNSFEVNGGEFPGQPSKSANNGIEFSSGSLGMGLSYGLGVAMAKKTLGGNVYVVVGDGELNEGSNWEAAALASQYKLKNLTVIVDNNAMQSDGHCKDIVGQDLNKLWNAYGWKVVSCNGHSADEIKECLYSDRNDKPLAILANTVKGKGVSFMENDNSWHHAVLTDENYAKAMDEVGGQYGLR